MTATAPIEPRYVSEQNYNYVIDVKPRCNECGKLLAESVARPWVIRCGRCGHTNKAK